MSAPYVLFKDEGQDENTLEPVGPAWFIDGEAQSELFDGGWLPEAAAREEAARRQVEFRVA